MLSLSVNKNFRFGGIHENFFPENLDFIVDRHNFCKTEIEIVMFACKSSNEKKSATSKLIRTKY